MTKKWKAEHVCDSHFVETPLTGPCSDGPVYDAVAGYEVTSCPVANIEECTSTNGQTNFCGVKKVSGDNCEISQEQIDGDCDRVLKPTSY